VLVAAAIGLMIWLYRRSPVFMRRPDEEEETHEPEGSTGTVRALGLPVAGTGVMVLGAELLLRFA
jgi:uncharacterized iron-regulated membrane protein